MEEFWKDIPEYEGYYQVSNLGRVKSVDRLVAHGRFGLVKAQGKLLKPALQVDGYLKVALSKDRRLVSYTIHRLIGRAFFDEYRSRDLEINHIDGNKCNNNIDNLELITHAQNVQHAFDNGLAKGMKGSKNPNSKLTESDVLTMRLLWGTGMYMQKEIAGMFNVSTGHVKDIVNRRNDIWNI